MNTNLAIALALVLPGLAMLALAFVFARRERDAQREASLARDAADHRLTRINVPMPATKQSRAQRRRQTRRLGTLRATQQANE